MTTINQMSVNINMDNAAFDPDKWGEVARILHRIANRIYEDDLPYNLSDINGNVCGTIVYSEVKS